MTTKAPNKPLPRIILAALLASVAAAAAGDPDTRHALPAQGDEILTVAISNGDNDIVFNRPPLDSRENIDAFFDVLKELYGARRIYWRAGQIEQLVNHSKARPENVTFHFLWDYLHRLYNDPDFNPSRAGVASAKERGMEIWAWCALFDHGGQAVVDTRKGTGPSPVEAHIRLENPEWIPVDRHGIRRMSGGICFGYPEARKALVELFKTTAIQDGYDGIMFHTYIEQFDARCEEEFGFNDPVVEAYKEKYGVDIRSEDFDPEKLAAIRGEHLTQFFRELRAALKPHGIKIGIFLDPRRPERPAPWLSSRQWLFSPAGAVRIDWRGLVREGLVDELISYFNGPNQPFAAELYEKTKDTPTTAGLLSSGGYAEEYEWMRGVGVNRIIVGDYLDIEHGYFEPVDADVMDGEDFIAKITFLRQMETGATPLDAGLLVQAASDTHPWVRRRAMAVAVAQQPDDPKILAAIRERLRDPVTGVRSYATLAAIQLGGSGMMEEIYDSISEHYEPPVTFAARSGLQNLPLERTDDLIQGTRHKDWQIRFLAARSLGGANRPGAREALLALADDLEWRVRWAVAEGLQRHPVPESTQTLLALLDDPHPTVRAMAALNLSKLHGGDTRWIGPEQFAVFSALLQRFADFDAQAERTDADWGWMPLGEALFAMGPRGREALEVFQSDTGNLPRAERAWQVLNVRLDTNTFLPVSFEEIDASYATHPRAGKAPPASDTDDEPALMPYIIQDFALRGREFAEDGTLGNARGEGRWSGLPTRLRRADSGEERSVVRLATGDQTDPAWVAAVRTDFRPADGAMETSLSLVPEVLGGELTIWLTNSAQWSSTLKIHISRDGVLQAADASGRMRDTGFQLEDGRGVEIVLRADLDQALYSIHATADDGEEQVLAEAIPLKPDEPYNQIVFIPGKEPGGIFLLRGMDWRVSNPAHGLAAAAGIPRETSVSHQ